MLDTDFISHSQQPLDVHNIIGFPSIQIQLHSSYFLNSGGSLNEVTHLLWAVTKESEHASNHIGGILSHKVLKYSDDVSKEGECLDLCSCKVHIHFFVECRRFPCTWWLKWDLHYLIRREWAWFYSIIFARKSSPINELIKKTFLPNIHLGENQEQTKKCC